MDLWSVVNWLDFGLYACKAHMRLYNEHMERPCKVWEPRVFERQQVFGDRKKSLLLAKESCKNLGHQQ